MKLPANHTVSWRFGNTDKSLPSSSLTPLKAIRAKCLDCSDGSSKEVKECPIHTCPLYPYRLGRRPKFAEKPL